MGYHSTRLPRWRSGHAVDCRSTTLRFKSGPWLTLYSIIGVWRGEECNVLRLHLKTTCGDSGHSFRETPGLIPNPAVKPEHVVYCTEVRESSGTIPSCYYLSFLHGILPVFLPASVANRYNVILFNAEQHKVHDLHDTLLVIAAIAFGKHLVSFRTQQLSRNT